MNTHTLAVCGSKQPFFLLDYMQITSITHSSLQMNTWNESFAPTQVYTHESTDFNFYIQSKNRNEWASISIRISRITDLTL